MVEVGFCVAPNLRRLIMRFRDRGRTIVVFLITVVALSELLGGHYPIFAFQGQARFDGAISSGPLAMSADSTTLAVVNPDNNSVSIFDVGNDAYRLLGEVPVGKEPWGVGMTPDGSTLFVANTAQGTVSVLKVNKGANPPATVAATIDVGTEPYGVVVTPNGTKVYVSNSRSNSISVIDPSNNTVTKTISNVGPATGGQPMGLAVTNNGNESDTDETLYVTHFFSFANNKLDGEDDSKTGLVTKISTQSDSIAG